MLRCRTALSFATLFIAVVAKAEGPAPLPKSESPALATVKPPALPKTNGAYISETDVEKLALPQQPEALKSALASLSQGSIDERIARLKAKALSDLVYVRGGTFLRGDFADQLHIEGATKLTGNDDDKDARQITLSDFWISKYKTTYAEMDVFADATHRPKTGNEYDGKYRHPLLPAGTQWQYAKDYCTWLGSITGQHFDLPTEAQWEFAARSRGQFFVLATDDGNLDYGRNVPYSAEKRLLSPIPVENYAYPVGLFPPTPLGLYDMDDDGEEWTNDWYDANAYAHSGEHDPQGPKSGKFKVVRGWSIDHGELKPGATVLRGKMDAFLKNPKPNRFFPVVRYPTIQGPTVRCAVNARSAATN